MKRLILATAVAILISCTAFASESDYINTVSEAIQGDVGEGETINSVTLSGRKLIISVDLADEYDIPTEYVEESRVGSITDSILVLEQDEDLWDTVIVDFGNLGAVINQRADVVDEGHVRYFDLNNYEYISADQLRELVKDDSANETTETETPATAPEYEFDLLGDGKVQYHDGVVSYSWDSTDYSYSIENDYFEVSKYIDGIKYTFSIIASQNTLPDDIGHYAAQALNAYIPDRPVGTTFAMCRDSVPGFEDYVCAETGTQYTGSDYFSVVYGITDMKKAFVIAITAHGDPSKMEELHDWEFENHQQNFRMLQQMSDLVETVEFQ